MIQKPKFKTGGQFIGVLQDIGLHQLVQVSNLLSLSRVVLIIPVCILLLRDQPGDNFTALILMFIAALTDFFDGMFARILNQVSALGKLLDPLADKICIVAVALTLANEDRAIHLEGWLLTSVIVRDLLIVVCGYWMLRAKNIIMVSNWWGKWTSGAMSWLMFLVTMNFEPHPWQYFYLDIRAVTWITFSLLAASSISYMVRFFDIVSTGEPAPPVTRTGKTGQ